MVIPEELASFLESGLSITAATRDADLRPDGARAFAVRVHEGREHLTAFFHAKAAPAILANLAACPLIAFSIDRPSDNRACQIKGEFTGSRKGRAAERALVERQVDLLRAGQIVRLTTEPPGLKIEWQGVAREK